MKGKYFFRAESDELIFDFEIRRNITVLQGDSASGKTTLLDILFQFSRDGVGSGFYVETNAKYYVYLTKNVERTWYEDLSRFHDTVIFIEENNDFVFTKFFAQFVNTSGNYFVIVNREPLWKLAYSTKEIYKLESELSKDGYTQVYHFKNICPKFSISDNKQDEQINKMNLF